MDAPHSGFLSELESFWNVWASERKDFVFVVCGSSTSWMVKKIIKNKGGLHNRLSHRISLNPFPLGLCEKLVQSRGLVLNRKQILEAYMIFGGVPYYWSLLQKGTSITADLDRQERIYACYQHACLKYVTNDKMTNLTLRERLGIDKQNYPMASRIIKDALVAGKIKEEKT